MIAGLRTAWLRLLVGRAGAVAFGPETDPALGPRLAALRARLPDTAGNRRIFARPSDAAAEMRRAQWNASRTRACEAAEELLGSGVAPERLGLSVSHCVGASIAIAWDGTDLGAGVDLESASRRISAGAAERFAYAPELARGFSPLDLWCVKEAAFKASPAEWNAIVADYELADAGTLRFAGKPAEPLGFELVRSREWTVAFAVAKTG